MSASLSSLEPKVTMTNPQNALVMKSPLGVAAVSFMIVTSFVFVLLFSFKPSWVCVTSCDGDVAEPRTADAGKCVIVSMIVALLVLILGWVFVATKY